MKVKSLIVMLAITLCIKANANNYYFSDSDGDDLRTSTQAQNAATPWKSLAKLNAFFPFLAPGDVVYFKSGDTFYGSIVTTKSGTSAAPITLTSYGSGQKPTITGLTTISQWTSVGNGIYESNVLPAGITVNVVLINGSQYAMGRYPNANTANSGYLTFESHGGNSITDNESSFNSTWTNAMLVVRTTHGSIERTKISGVSGKTIYYSPSLNYSPINNYGYFVQNDIKTLDQFGEWYYNPVTHKLNVYFGNNNPGGYTVQASTNDILFTAHSGYITLSNLRFRGANTYGIYADWKGMSNIQVKNCKVVYSGINAVALAGTTNFLMDNCEIQNSNSNAIDLYYANVTPTIRNTTIKNTATFQGMMQKDLSGRYGMGIYSTDGLTAMYNTIINTGFIGINYAGNNNLIQNNYINNFCTTLDDGGGIYTYTGKSNTTFYNRKVIGNIVVNGVGARGGTYNTDPNYNPVEGIYFDDNSTNVEVYNNTVSNCGDAGMYVHNSRGIIIKNNVLYNNYIQLAFQSDALGYGVSEGVVMHNQAFSKTSAQLVLMLQSQNNDFSKFGIYDSNYYCRPFNENSINYTNWFSNKDGFYNLPSWQSTYNKDWHTKKTPVPVTDTTDILFQFNPSNTSKTITLNGTYVGLNGVTYTKSVQIAPYSSILLLKSASSSTSVSSKSSATAESSVNIAAAGNGYVANDAATKLTVKAYPNPSSYYFNVTAQGNSTEPMTLRIIDLSGRLIETRTGITNNSTLQIGQNLTAGYYVVELIQGTKKVQQKIIKMNK